MSVPKEYKLLVKNQIPSHKTSSLVRFQNKKFYNVSVCKSNFLQRVRYKKTSQSVRFSIKKFTTCQILNQKFYNVSDFISKILQSVRFCFEKVV